MKDIIGTICHPSALAGVSLASAAAIVRKRPDAAAQLAVGVPFALGISKVLKYAVDEHRPRLFASSPEQSFPSGHSVGITALGLSAAAASRTWWLLPVAIAAVATVNISRLRTHEHWPKDVIVGDLVGIAGALAGAGAAYLVARRRRAATTARSADRARRRGSAED